MTMGSHPAGAWLRRAARRLEQAGVDSPLLSAQLLLAHTLGMSRERMYLDLPQLDPTCEEFAHADALLERRAQGEPVAYLLGCREFYGLDFRVTPDVLIPRPETELLVDMGVAHCRELQGAGQSRCVFADLGTGSGAIAVSLAHELDGVCGLALDLSRTALIVALDNARKLGALSSVCFLQGDFSFLPLASCSLDLVVSNPPYVSGDEYRELSCEVRDFEPLAALVPWGADASSGLESIQALAGEAWRVLRPGGLLLVEMGCGQGREGLSILQASGAWQELEVVRDLAGLDRVLRARR